MYIYIYVALNFLINQTEVEHNWITAFMVYYSLGSRSISVCSTLVSALVMQSIDEDHKKKKTKNLKRSRSSNCDMPVTDSNVAPTLGNCSFFPVEEIVQHPLPGYLAPTSISFSPDDSMVTYLFSPDQTLNRKVFSFDLKTGKQELFFSPPDGGLDESNISPEEKLRRERLRERGLGVTRYEWVKIGSKKKVIMVPLPAGVCSIIL
jgi:dipeptidyl-peptidase-4